MKGLRARELQEIPESTGLPAKCIYPRQIIFNSTIRGKDHLLGGFNKSQRIKDYLLSAFHPRKKGLPARELE